MSMSLRLLVAVATAFSAPAFGAIVQYTIDRSRSTLTLSGTFEGVPFLEQTPGSLTARYQGLIRGDLENGMLALQANGPVSEPQSIPQQPMAQNENLGLASFGFQAETPNTHEILFAIGALSLYLSTEYRSPLDVTDGVFAPGDIAFFIDGGTVYHSSARLPLGSIDVHGRGAPNRALSQGALTIDGDVETLTIPLATEFDLTAFAPDDLHFSLSGQIVATRMVPEPTTSLLVLLGIAVFAGGRNCRRASTFG